MAVLDGRRTHKQKQRPLSGSFSHQKIQERDLRPDQGFPLRPRHRFASEPEQNASPDEEDEEAGNKA